jgi:hypothetical protein
MYNLGFFLVRQFVKYAIVSTSEITILYLFQMKHTLLFTLLFLMLVACEGTKNSTQTTTNKTPNQASIPQNNSNPTPVSHQLDFDLDKYRNTLGDANTTKSNELPSALQLEEAQPSQRNDFLQSGYRIQLISTSDRIRAEKVVADFNNWLFADSTITYKAESYIIFRQPNYRVHIGDFKSRIQANEFNKVVKRRFSDAWIIQDQINEDKTPDNIE